MMKLLISLLVLFAANAYARYLDEEPEMIREEVMDPSQRFVTTDDNGYSEQPAPEDDSCDDYPPASCIAHFQPLPRSLNRSPFGLRTPHEFDLVCGSYRKALPCISQWINRCHPIQPDAVTFVENLLQLLNQCDDNQVRSDALVALDCGRRMGSVHDRCTRETRYIDRLKDLTPENLVRGRSTIADLCCGMRFHKACFMDYVQQRCGAEALSANRRLEEMIMRAFNCDAHPESECAYKKPR